MNIDLKVIQNTPDPALDIRAFLQQDRERILRAIRKRSTPHIAPSHYYKSSGDPSLMWIDRVGPAMEARSTVLDGFIAKTIIGLMPDGIVMSEDKGSLKTVKFADLPYEDLMKVSRWVARKLPAPPIERDPAMQAFLEQSRAP